MDLLFYVRIYNYIYMTIIGFSAVHIHIYIISTRKAFLLWKNLEVILASIRFCCGANKQTPPISPTIVSDPLHAGCIYLHQDLG